jgi:hypothetical protein
MEISGRTQTALASIPLGLKAIGADYPILRVFASWPGRAQLNQSMDWKENRDTKMRSSTEPPNQFNREQSVDDIEDPDLHPLATLHLDNFEKKLRWGTRQNFLASMFDVVTT